MNVPESNLTLLQNTDFNTMLMSRPLIERNGALVQAINFLVDRATGVIRSVSCKYSFTDETTPEILVGASFETLLDPEGNWEPDTVPICRIVPHNADDLPAASREAFLESIAAYNAACLDAAG